MSDLNTEEFCETDSSDNEENHSKLLSSISQLDSTQRVKPAQRREPKLKVSEYDLTERIPTEKNLISVNELADVLGKSSKHGVVTKKLKSVTSKSKTLPKPLEKTVAEQIKRSLGFENVVKQLERWDAIVTRNAVKDQIKFPLNDNSMKMEKSDKFLSQFQSSTPLEEEIMKVLKPEKKEEEQKDNEFSLTLEEMLEKRKEMAFLRAKVSYKAAKAFRQNKIKSKKYHRILRREKLRQQLKEFELLQKTDPEAALKKLAELDKTRAVERASLRHRNTGHWAKNMTVRAKYDIESRKILAEQLKLSRELTEKVNALDDSDNEEPEEPIPQNSLNGNSDFKLTDTVTENPWDIKISKEVHDFVSGYKKYWNEQNKTAKDSADEKAEEYTEKNIEKNENIKDSSNGHEIRQQLPKSDPPKISMQSQKPVQSDVRNNNASVKTTTDIDPDNYIKIKPKRLRTHLPDDANNDEDNVDDDRKHAMTIEEAFVDDDIVAEFKEMKNDTEKIKEIEIETSLPGWGEWGGSGTVPKKRKKSRLVVNVPPRKDKGKKDTIINENANPNLKNHLVKDVPHPFESVEAFEANIRAPVGREWVPETAHWKLIQKEVETKLGTVIDPMDEDELVRKKKDYKSLYKGKIKNQGKKLRK